MNLEELQRMKQRFRIIGNAPELNRAIDVAIQVAPTDLTVLITGESGSGKDVIPRIIHDNSTRKSKKYLAVNCGAIPEGTIDSELFGHVKGSFTNAINDRMGYFGEATAELSFWMRLPKCRLPHRPVCYVCWRPESLSEWVLR